MIETNSNEMEIDLIEYLQILWRRKWLLIGLFVLAVVVAFVFVQQMDPIYQTSATIMIQENDGMENLFAGELFSMGQNNSSSTYTMLIKTRSIMNQVIQRVDLRDANGELLSPSSLASKISVRPVNGTGLIEISLEDKDPKKAQKIVNTLVDVFQEANVKMNKVALTSALDFIETQKFQTEIALKNAEDELLKYKTENKAILPTEEAKQSLAQLVEIERLKSMAEVELGSTEASIQMINAELQKHTEKLVSATVISRNPLIDQYKGQITELQTTLLGLQTKFTANHPDVLAVEEKIKHIEAALSKEVERDISTETVSTNPIFQSLNQSLVSLESTRLANEAKLASYTQLFEELEKDFEKLPLKEMELVRLERKAKVTSEIYTMLMTRAEEVKISEAMETSDVYLVDDAYLPLYPIKPNKKAMIAITGIVALLAGIGMIILWEYFDNTVKSAEQIENMLGLPVLGSIPDITKLKK